MGRRSSFLHMVGASRDEAKLATRLYNDPAEIRSFEGFVVHMHLAWLYLLHAEFSRDGDDFRYRQPENPKRFVKIDGEPKSWELGKCVSHRWPNPTDPVRLNVEFFIGLRNKIEHRFARQQNALTVALCGHAQALLLNYEKELTDQFGPKYSMASVLQFPVFVGSFTDAGEQALRELRSTLPSTLRNFVTQYESGLSPEVGSDSRFEFRIRLMQELAQKDPSALAIQFTRYDDMSEAQKELAEQLGRRGQVVVRERLRNVVGNDLIRPLEVVAAVDAKVPFTFTMVHFIRAWQKLNVRPKSSSEHPEVTNEKYCVYDKLSRSYGYTEAYVKMLIEKCNNEDSRRELIGWVPV